MANESHIESWTADEVVAFLGTLNLAQYGDDFLENAITGDILVHLEHEALTDIGIESVGHRLALLRAVYNVKVADNVTIEPEHYVPATAEMEHATGATNVEISKDLLAITQAIQLRDEKLAVAEQEIKRLTENLTRLKDQLSPVFKIVKELQPLPTPDISTISNVSTQPALSRKFSTKKLFLGSAPRQQSPTHTPPAYINHIDPESPRSPNRYTEPSNLGRSQTPTSHVMHTTSRETSNGLPRLPAPPRPPPPGVTPLNTIRETHSRQDREEPMSASQQLTPSSSSTSTSTSSTTNNAASSSSSSDPFKSFRVGLEDPCSKVLPAALKKYKINDDWREYSLFICYANEERCLGLDEKPLLVFQELQKQNKSPVFMLRRQEASGANNGGGGATAAAAAAAASARGDHEVKI